MMSASRPCRRWWLRPGMWLGTQMGNLAAGMEVYLGLADLPPPGRVSR